MSIVKIVFICLTLGFGGLTAWMYHQSVTHRTDNFGEGIAILLLAAITIIFMACSFVFPIQH